MGVCVWIGSGMDVCVDMFRFELECDAAPYIPLSHVREVRKEANTQRMSRDPGRAPAVLEWSEAITRTLVGQGHYEKTGVSGGGGASLKDHQLSSPGSRIFHLWEIR